MNRHRLFTKHIHAGVQQTGNLFGMNGFGREHKGAVQIQLQKLLQIVNGALNGIAFLYLPDAFNMFGKGADQLDILTGGQNRKVGNLSD